MPRLTRKLRATSALPPQEPLHPSVRAFIRAIKNNEITQDDLSEANFWIGMEMQEIHHQLCGGPS